jgi:hypothetical protein
MHARGAATANAAAALRVPWCTHVCADRRACATTRAAAGGVSAVVARPSKERQSAASRQLQLRCAIIRSTQANVARACQRAVHARALLDNFVRPTSTIEMQVACPRR